MNEDTVKLAACINEMNTVRGGRKAEGSGMEEENCLFNSLITII